MSKYYLNSYVNISIASTAIIIPSLLFVMYNIYNKPKNTDRILDDDDFYSKNITVIKNKSQIKRIIILYSTTTGTAKTFSFKLQSNISKFYSNIEVTILNIIDYDEEKLNTEDLVLILMSTYTDGQVPQSGKRFVEWLYDMINDFRVDRNHLGKLKYAVFGLGGAIYAENYGKAAITVHSLLGQLGAQAILPIVLGDDAFNLNKRFKKWISEVIEQIGKYEKNKKTAIAVNVTINKSVDSTCCKTHTEKNGSSECCSSDKTGVSNVVNVINDSIDNVDDNEEEEEDRINSKYAEYDSEDELFPNVKTFKGVEDDEPISIGKDSQILDMEDLGNSTNKDRVNPEETREMVTKLQRKALVKEGYRIIGSHSAVKLCRWTNHQMRGRGGCYKHTFYGITSYQCMEATPSLACANKCVFCWRHHKNPVGTTWRWKTDEPDTIVSEAISLHRTMINEMKGVPGVLPERLAEAMTVRHCALSLVGEPIMYPRINELLYELHVRNISTFLVTNAQFPECIRNLDPVTQLYVSVDAASKESLKAIDRPLFKDYWQRFLDSLEAMKLKQQRTVYRLTLVKSWNMSEIDGYVELIEHGQPDFIEIKGVTYCGKSDASSLTMDNCPWHYEVCKFAETISDRLQERQNCSTRYSIATEHEHSCCILLAREDKFLRDGIWCTWIDYPKYNQLIMDYYTSNKTKLFTSMDYISPTPDWACYNSPSKGFDPIDTRWRRKKTGQLVEIPYQPSESGCG